MAKILLVTNLWTSTIGGAERYVFQIASFLQSSDRSNKILIGVRTRDQSTFEYLSSKATKFLPDVEILQLGHPTEPFASAKITAQSIASIKPDIIHLNFPDHRFTAHFLFPIKKTRIPIVFTQHIFPSFSAKGILGRKHMLKMAALAGTHAIAITKYNQRYINKYYWLSRLHIHSIYYGIDHQRFSPIPEKGKKILRKKLDLPVDKVIITQLARLADAHKNQSTSIRSLSFLDRPLLENINLLLVGEGESKSKLVSLVKALHLKKYVNFLGEVNSPEKILQASDIFLLPSHVEGLPYAVLEAMGCGLPCITSKLPGMIEALEDGKCGIILPSTTPQDIAKAIQELISNPKKRTSLGNKARARVEKAFSEEMMRTKTLALYSQILGTKQK